LIYRLVFENLKHRPVRTIISALLIGGQVAVILTLVGVSRGTLEGMAQRSRGTGADIIVRPPDSSVFGFGSSMPEGLVEVIAKMDHVAQATGALVHPTGGFDSITGIHLDEFNRMSGGLKFLEGGPFQAPDDIVVDRVFAQQRNLHPGDRFSFGHTWRVTGVVEEGKLSRTFADIRALQDIFAENGKISMVYVKLDDPAHLKSVVAALEARLPGYKIYPMEEFVSLFTVSGAPLLEGFTRVVIGVAALGGFLVVLQSMYMAVLERTREIGILKAMGASPGYIMSILLREAAVLALAGTALGIAMTYGTRELMAALAPNFPQAIVPDWYPWAALIALGGALAGALYPGLKAARQDAIEALAYD
jgi:putative ABC transport system permease protein